jgi:uncharacterized membrane protein
MAPGKKRLSVYITSLLHDGYKRKQIESYLVEHGHSRAFVQEMVAETIKLQRSRTIMKGLALLLAGAIICLLCSLFADMPWFAKSTMP